MPVAEKRKVHSSQGDCPVFVGMFGVNAYTQNLGVEILKKP